MYLFPCDCELKTGVLSKELFPAGQEANQIPKGRTHTHIRVIVSTVEPLLYGHRRHGTKSP